MITKITLSDFKKLHISGYQYDNGHWRFIKNLATELPDSEVCIVAIHKKPSKIDIQRESRRTGKTYQEAHLSLLPEYCYYHYPFKIQSFIISEKLYSKRDWYISGDGRVTTKIRKAETEAVYEIRKI